MPKVTLLVEGPGDVAAVPRLIHTALARLGIQEVFTDNRPMKVGDLPKLRREGELEKHLRYAAAKPFDIVLLALDCDDDCPVTVATELARRAAAMVPALAKPVGIVLFHREFETLFLHSLEAIAGGRPDFGWKLEGLDPDDSWERKRGAKEVLRRFMAPGKTYKETIHQVDFIKELDLDRLHDKSRSYRHLESTLRWVAGQHAEGAKVYPMMEAL